MSKPNKPTCECADPACPSTGHAAGLEVCGRQADQTLYRVDMADETGTPMCVDCADDAFDSGLFR